MNAEKLQQLRSGEYLNIGETWQALDELIEILGPAEVLDQLAKCLTNDDLQDNLKYIARINDIGNTEEE